MVRQWFAMSIFRVLCRMRCISISAPLTIVLLAEAVFLHATSARKVLFQNESQKFISVTISPGVARERADKTKVTEVGHDEIRPVYQDGFADCGMSRGFAYRFWHLFIGTVDDFTKYPMLGMRDGATRY